MMTSIDLHRDQWPYWPLICWRLPCELLGLISKMDQAPARRSVLLPLSFGRKKGETKRWESKKIRREKSEGDGKRGRGREERREGEGEEERGERDRGKPREREREREERERERERESDGGGGGVTEKARRGHAKMRRERAPTEGIWRYYPLRKMRRYKIRGDYTKNRESHKLCLIVWSYASGEIIWPFQV